MIIAIAGRRGSGKDTFADMLVYMMERRYNRTLVRESFARPIKEFVSMTTGCTLEQLEDREFKESELPTQFQNHDKGIITYRNLMQQFGCEAVRDNIHEEYWVNSLLARIGHGMLFNTREETEGDFIITDLRFPNEFDALKERGAFTVRIDRGVASDGHASEKELDRVFDMVVDNHGTIADLRRKALDLSRNLILQPTLQGSGPHI